ncbi:MAG TPA: tetratricopeptide repeat protein [Syntrophothermus lipocalidus]|mgnify:CR=1 FL=1|nr:tetratricopeptide repeat protein [Syntrophothermus lipocalidus]HOV42401.1 tetratricopeptide repeat protein [Syntrophothermus lipocalidus]
MKRQGKCQGGRVALLAVAVLFTSLISGCFGSTEAKVNKQLELAVKYVSENKFDEAVLAYQEVINIDKREVRAYQGLGKVYTLQGKFDKAQETYDQGIEAVKEEDVMRLKLSLAGMYMDKGDPVQAEKAYKEIIDEDKTAVEAYQGLAMIYERNGEGEQALAVLEQGILANQQDYRAHNALASYYARNGEKDKAVESIVQSLALDVNQAEAYRILKDMYSEDWSELIDKAGSIEDQGIGNIMRFYALYESGQYQEALSLYEEELKQDEANQKAAVLAAACMFKSGDEQKAGELVQKIAEKPANEWIMADIAGYYLLTGDKDKALAWAGRSLAANEQNLDALKILVSAATKEQEQLANRYITRLLIYTWQPVYIVQEDMYANSLPAPVKPENNRLTYDYFIPRLDYEYTYQDRCGGTSREIKTSWEKDAGGLYSRYMVEAGVKYPSFSTDYYKVTSSGIAWTGGEAGQYASESWNHVPLGNERCMVLAFVNPNTEWTSNYRMKEESYETSIENYTRTSKYLGVERIEVMGKTMDAAHIRYVETQNAEDPMALIKESTDMWCVRGLGMVKATSICVYNNGSQEEDTLELVSVSPKGNDEAAGNSENEQPESQPSPAPAPATAGSTVISPLTQERAREMVLALPEVKQYLAQYDNFRVVDYDKHVDSKGTLFFDFWAYWDMTTHTNTFERYSVNSLTGDIYKENVSRNGFVKYVDGSWVPTSDRVF